VFGRDGAIEALLAARQAGKLRYIGFTGHKDPRIHLSMLSVAERNGFAFDTVQMPLNVMDAHFRSFQHDVVPVASRVGTAILGMKPLGGGVFFRSPPLRSGDVNATQCLQYAMSLPASVVITGCESVSVLEQALNAAMTFEPWSHAQRNDLEARTANAAAQGAFERFKTTEDYDGTSHNPRWLDSASL
jgi:predicted aldo/keto reductase-like oxidoreductase